MSERQALLVAAGMHVALLGALSMGLSSMPPLQMEPDVTPVEFVEISNEALTNKIPEPSMDVAPQEVGAPPEEATAEPVEPEPVPPVPAEKPRPAPKPEPKPTPDEAPQDALAQEVKKTPPKAKTPEKPTPPKKVENKPEAKPKPAAKVPPKAAARPATPAPVKSKTPTERGQNATLIDKNKKDGPVRPRDVSDFAKSIEDAIPKASKLSPLQAATLEQAIRAQIAPCWNPPMGGADVQGMTAVLKIRLNADGTVVGAPAFISQTGANAENQAYARAFVETAKRAVLRCAPLKLPADLYSHWREFELNFDPRLMT